MPVLSNSKENILLSIILAVLHAGMSELRITIRNLACQNLSFVLLERFELAKASNGSPLLQKDKITSTPGPSNLQLGKYAQYFLQRELDIQIYPFCSKSSDITGPHGQNTPKSHDNFRLTFLIADQKYRICLSSPRTGFQKVECLTSGAKQHFIAISIRQTRWLFIAICERMELNSWMKNLFDHTPLSALSIPGTHNSPTCYYALPSVRCQVASPTYQLENGVRFFDVRVQPSTSNENLILVHSAFSISLTGTKYFHDFLTVVYEFLDRHPSESIIMSVKREGVGSATDADLAKVLHDHYTTASSSTKYWYVSPDIPSLGSVRGRIVLLRRFCASNTPYAHESGINAESWTDNTAYDHGEFICVQDFYKVMKAVNIGKKIQCIEEQLARAAARVAVVPGENPDKDFAILPQPFYLNFLSASNFWRLGCWPEEIAKKVNPYIMDYLLLHHAVDEQYVGHDEKRMTRNKIGDGSTGIVVCDWVGESGDWNLVRCIVAMNSKLVLRELERQEAQEHFVSTDVAR